MRCFGDMIAADSKNLDALDRKFLKRGATSRTCSEVNTKNYIADRTSSMQEFVAADYVFKSFCEVANAYSISDMVII